MTTLSVLLGLNLSGNMGNGDGDEMEVDPTPAPTRKAPSPPPTKKPEPEDKNLTDEQRSVSRYLHVNGSQLLIKKEEENKQQYDFGLSVRTHWNRFLKTFFIFSCKI